MEIPRVREVSKAQFLKESVTLKWKFWRGGGFKLKNLQWEGYGYFLEQHNVQTDDYLRWNNSSVCNESYTTGAC